MTRKATPLFAVVTSVVMGIGASTAGANPPAATPRTLPSGAPACGNSQTKNPRPCVTPVIVAQPAARPPVIATTAPACGDVLASVDGDTGSVAYQACINRMDPRAAIAGWTAIKNTLVLFGLRAAEPVPSQAVSPRRMRNGSPACGNVASRLPRRCDD